MIYLLDANVLIDASRDYYGFDTVPEFWLWLVSQGENGNIKIPIEVFEEIDKKGDTLSKWANQHIVKSALVLDEEVNPANVQRVLSDGYAPNLNDAEVEQLGRDPFLIAYALVEKSQRCVITTERSRPRRKRANKHIPDVCDLLDIQWHHAYDLYRVLNFNTRWDK